MTGHNEYESEIVQVRSTSRWHKKREVTFTCQRCGSVVTQWHYPGPTPRYCGECGPLVQKEKTRARVQRARQRKTRAEPQA